MAASEKQLGPPPVGATLTGRTVLFLCLASSCSVDDRVVTTPSDSSGGQGGSSGVADTTVVQTSGGTAGGGTAGGGTAGGGTGGEAPPVARATPNQLDLLFMIDNSSSMSDKQEVLRAAVPDLMNRLVNPICLDAAGNEFPAPPPGAECPGGQHRQFDPIADIHIGIVSSSMGDIGASSACPSQGSPSFVADRVDMAHLMGSLTRGQMASANANGFLEWREGNNIDLFNSSFQALVSAVGEGGCGWEASLEAWHRFLIDPKPYQGLTRVACDAQATTTDCLAPVLDAAGQVQLDEVLLAQRAAFLRPNSLVAIVMLTDENDCSLEPAGTNWLVAALIAEPMYRGTSACDTNPNDKCCRSCASPAPADCAAEPACDGDGVRLPALADGKNLRCFDQKRRFGYDFMYPTQRYVNALSQRQLCLDHPDLSTDGCASALVPNPLFSAGRTPDQVLLAGIVGVPWQAISASTGQNGQPLPSPDRQLRFKSSLELSDADWARIAGSAGTPWQAASAGVPEQLATPPVPPSEPTMVESPAMRSNVSSGNPVNGRDHDTASDGVTPDDLEYACIFPLPTPRDCTLRTPGTDACDCYPGALDRALCEVTPGNGTPGTTQYWAKAYPGLRQLQVLRGLGQSSVVSSICARNTADPNRPDYGYRPAMSAIIEGLQPQLARR
ncbi:MAG: hypothetical protein ABI895_19515 [Deltaproteobacteria bacterium]